jgi:Colicin immunity protein / pyocin immunity protein
MGEKMSREELIELVRKIMDAEGSEEEIDVWLDELERNVPHPEVSDLIFWPKKEPVTPEEVVDEALAYKPVREG